MDRNDAWAGLAALAATQHGVVSRPDATSHKIDAQRLRRAVKSGRMRQILSDVFAFGSTPDTRRQRCMAVSLAGGVISHRTAAGLHEFDGFALDSGPVDVCFERGKHRDLSRVGPVAPHTWSFTNRKDIATVDGIRVTSIARTLVQLGSVCDREQVEIALDSALRVGVSPLWIEDTFDRLRRRGPWGGNVLEEIISDAHRDGALPESVLERLVERVLATPGLPTPIRQHEVMTEAGPKRLDLAFPEVKLGIEGHSKQVHFGNAAEEADNLRDFALAAEGWEILYVTWGMAHQPAFFLELLKRTYLNRLHLFRGGHTQSG